MVNLIDKVISYISPKMALEREIARQELSSIRNYAGAKLGRDQDFISVSGDANNDLLPFLPTLVARSRDLVRNNSWARSIINTYINYVIGPYGILPQVTSHSGNIDIENMQEERILGILNNLDLAKKLKFRAMQRMVLRTLLVDGECFLRKVIVKEGYKYCMRYQFIESDQIYATQEFNNSTGNEIIGGIEVDKTTSERVAYYISVHPGSSHFFLAEQDNEVRVPANQIIHIYVQDRPNQMRGEPILAPVINDIRNLKEMDEAALVKARIEACLAVFITKAGTGQRPSTTPRNIRPGMIAELGTNESVQSIAPKTAGTDYGNFSQHHLQGVGAGTGLSYETVSHDYSRSNFSSARLSKRDENKTYECVQAFICEEFCKPVMRDLEDLEILNGNEPFPMHHWHAPGFGWVDPEKEISADVMAVDANFVTLAEVIAKRTGKSYRDVLRQRGIEKKLEIEEGVASEDANAGARAAIAESRR